MNVQVYAPRFYLEHPKAVSDGFRRVLSLDETQEAVLEALKESPYGRCVYHCDNDVVDHQVVNLEFEGGLTASLTMCAFTDRCERVISLHGSHGEIRGWMRRITALRWWILPRRTGRSFTFMHRKQGMGEATWL